jgi:3-deoxy-D-manno-octulosonate 8-phosphate phosphatase KdsC-like HAD superfamily phosphatase
VRDIAHVQLTRTGGAGAVREFVELLLKARGEWTRIVESYVTERSRPIKGRTS